MIEIWKDIPNYEGKYQVSNLGRVKSFLIKRNLPNGKIMSNNSGKHYVLVHLMKNNKRETINMHRLVASLFIPNPKNKKVVNHKDCNKKNNYYKNLEWCTKSDDRIHAEKNGLIKHKTRRVKQFTKDGVLLKIWESLIKAGRETKTDVSSIGMCCRKHTRYSQAGGFKWEYAK